MDNQLGRDTLNMVNHSPNKRQLQQERNEKIFNLWKQGMKYSQLSERFGLDDGNVWYIIRNERRKRMETILKPQDKPESMEAK